MKMLLLLLLLTIIAPEAAAEIYKWLDRNGSIVYSQSPPPADASSLKTPEISSSPDNSGTPIKAVEEILNSDRESREQRRALQRQRTDEKANTALINQVRQSCQQLRENLEMMKRTGGRLYMDESGRNNPILSENALSQKIQDAEQQIQNYCTE